MTSSALECTLANGDVEADIGDVDVCVKVRGGNS